MRISDWSSDFCSSDLQNQRSTERCGHKRPFEAKNELSAAPAPASPLPPAIEKAIGGKNAYVITPEGNDLYTLHVGRSKGLPETFTGLYEPQALDRTSTRPNSSH